MFTIYVLCIRELLRVRLRERGSAVFSERIRY